MTTISVCIIAKDEENYIFDCIKSVLDIADEIILLDTGSTDKTIEIAKTFNKVKIYQTEWENDFSKAMNQCISYSIYDWVLCIDADERINEYTQRHLKNYLDNHQHKDKSLIIKFHSINVDSNRFTQNYYRCGVFKNNQGMYFVIPAHQYLVNDKNDIIIEHSNSFIFHHFQSATKESIKTRNEKYIQILLDFLKTPESDKHRFYCLRHIGDSYHDLENYNKSVEYYIKSYESQKDILKNFFYVENLLRLSKDILFQTLEYERGLPYIQELIDTAPDLKLSLFYYAYVNHRLGYFDKSIEHYLKSLEMKSDYLDIQILGELARAYISIENLEKGLEYLNHSYNKNPKTYVIFHLIKYYALDNDLENTIKYELIKNDYAEININKEIKKVSNLSKIEYFNLLKLKLTYLSNLSGWDKWELEKINEKILALKINL